jgi:jumonji domain-containing protein 2
MVYFGMWKSFFSWHVEDVDLYSINYLHFGAPKVWYCVSPKDRVKFENMAKGLFPELYNICPAFLRHKDILLSPKTLRNHHIEYVQAKQEAGEFVVLNAGAYHSGFNLGFNCAEAVNFATEDWLATGNEATQCTCDALPDHVTLDMKIFKRGHRVSQRIKAALQKAESESENSESGGEEDDENSDSEVEGSDSEEEESGAAEASSSDAEDPEEAGVQKAASKRRRVAANPSRRTPKSRSLNELHSRPAKPPPKRRPPQPKAAVRKASPPKQTLTRTLAIKQLSKAAARRGATASSVKPPPKAQPKPAAARPAATGTKAKAKRGASAVLPAPPRRSPHSNSAVAKLAAARGHGSKRLAGVQPSAVEPISTPRVKRQRTSQGGAEAANKPAASAEATRVEDENSSSVRRAYEWVRSLMASTSNAHPNGRLIPGSQSASNMYSPSGLDTDGEALYAVVAREEQTKERCFYLVQKVQKKAKRPQDVTVRWLQAGEDQIFRPTAETWEEAAEALVPVRSQPCHVRGKHMPPGYRLLAQPLEQILGGKAEE